MIVETSRTTINAGYETIGSAGARIAQCTRRCRGESSRKNWGGFAFLLSLRPENDRKSLVSARPVLRGCVNAGPTVINQTHAPSISTPVPDSGLRAPNSTLNAFLLITAAYYCATRE